ncbi:hypothetical protein K439DRAFT_1328797 [Ramaria rubella]|nr:hypothetical protein K439DRAFT_1328797 [Ramaria rubella]
MFGYASTLFLALLGAITVSAQSSSDIPLASKHFEYTALPYMVDTNDGPRGIQTGYNLCNSTTEGQSSRCQTAMVNSLDDFCIWGPQTPDSQIADTEGSLVAWCTKPGHGTRVIPPGALTGVQFMQTPDYLQVTGRINQSLINILHGDTGGEEDPHGADGRGNPLGSLIFSNGFPSNNGNNGTYQQVIEWHNFLGGDIFCMKACDPAGAHAADFCQHIFDRIGCLYNAPAAYQDGVFEKCAGDNQDYPGVYTGSDGKVSTFTQPPESLGAIQSMPYSPRIPASSNCVTYQSQALYAAAASVFPSSTTASSSQASTTANPSRTGSGANASGSPGANGVSNIGPRGGAVLAFAALAVVAA